MSNASLIADVLSQYRTNEEDRRDHFRRVVSKSFPFKPISKSHSGIDALLKLTMLDAIIDKASAQCEISINGNDTNDLKKQDISEFISLITQVYSTSPQPIHSQKKRGTSKFVSDQEDEERFLNLLRKMVKEIEDMDKEFLASMNNHFFDGTVEISKRVSQMNIKSPTLVNESKLEQDVAILEQKNNEQTEEINHLRDIIKHVSVYLCSNPSN